MKHDPICLEGLNSQDRAFVIQNVLPEQCDYCRIIIKARYDSRKAGYEEGYDHGTVHGYADGWRESLAGFREYLEKAVISKCAHTKYEGCQPCIHDEIVAFILGED